MGGQRSWAEHALWFGNVWLCSKDLWSDPAGYGAAPTGGQDSPA
jgi:hypothetical protein